jgi:serine protease AprX
MKKITLFFLLLNTLTINLFSQNTVAWRSKVAPEILAAFDRGESADLLVAFTEQADIKAAKMIHGKSAKAHYVFSRLQETAQRTQARAMKILQENDAAGNTLFLVNALSVGHAREALTRQLAELPEVHFVCYDPWIQFAGPAEISPEILTERGTIEWGVERVNAPSVWAMGYTGQGITVGGADTGYDWAHPALQTHYRGWDAGNSTPEHNYNWHDAIHTINPFNFDTLGNPTANPCGVDIQQPCDDHRHGTHTMGTMTGDDGLGNQIGVAPGAKWVGCRNMERGWGNPSSYIECFQWFLAPTDLGGQNPDPSKAPHVVNNSWYCDYVEGCTSVSVNELIHTAVINLRASGVMVVVSNGNFGSAGCGSTTGAPAYFEESFSVGSTRMNDTISSFSSRGPVLIDSTYRIKPNISAPGQNIRSSVLNGEYQNLSGTSMAGPHIVGVVALILSARPDLAGEVDILEDLLEGPAIASLDTIGCGTVSGSAVPNNTYGYGRVDALASLQAALALSPVNVPVAPGVDVTVAPNPVTSEAVFNIANLTGKTSLQIFSTDGKLIFSKNWTAIGHETLRVLLENQPFGVYFWQVTADSSIVSGKLVKS